MGRIYSLLTDDYKLLKQLIQYTGAGGVAALTEWTIFYGLFLLGVNYIICVIIAFTVATGVNYRLSKYIFVGGKFTRNKEIMLIYFISGIGLLLNLVLMWFFYVKLEIFSLLAKIMATGVVFFWNFIGRKYWVFKH